MDWLHTRGTDFDAMVLITESLPGATGRSIRQLAQAHETDPAQMVVDILLQDPDAWIIYHCINEDDMDAAILWNDSIIGSDSWSYPVNAPRSIGHPHPRTYGAFTRFLERYALKHPRIPFGHAVRKITSYPARWLKLPRRGRIAEGYFADLVVLDPANVREKATFADPRQFSEGAEYVWVNGTLMLEQGTLYEKRPGRVLRLAK